MNNPNKLAELIFEFEILNVSSTNKQFRSICIKNCFGVSCCSLEMITQITLSRPTLNNNQSYENI